MPKKVENNARCKPGNVALLVWDIPRSLREKFRRKCLKEGITMKEGTMRIMKAFCSD